MLERRDAVLIRNVHLCARRHEHSHDLLMSWPTVAQYDGFQERRPTKIVHMIDGEIRVEQCPDHLDMPALACRNQRRTAEAIIDLEVRLGPQHERENLQVSAGAG